jgi:hypothetical protein
MAEPPADADFLFYYHGSNVIVEPRNSTARQYLETTLGNDPLGWVNRGPVIEDSSVVPLVHKLIAAGFKVVGQRALVRTAPRLYVHKENWWLYTGGRVIPQELVGQVLEAAGRPN